MYTVKIARASKMCCNQCLEIADETPVTMGMREYKNKIEMLEKEVFILKLQLTHYKQRQRIDNESNESVELRVSSYRNAKNPFMSCLHS